jgi:hypothetical protein
MVNEEDVIRISFDGCDFQTIKEMGKKAELTSTSKCRTRGEAWEKKEIDQLVGQIGEAALYVYLRGSIEQYAERRKEINKNPFVSDGGSDYFGFDIDIKASLNRTKKKCIFLNMIVRPKEFKTDTVYVLAIVEEVNKDSCKVALVGYCKGNEIIDKDDKFGDAKILRGDKMHPLPSINSKKKFLKMCVKKSE